MDVDQGSELFKPGRTVGAADGCLLGGYGTTSVLRPKVTMSGSLGDPINSKMSHVLPPDALQLHQQATETPAAARDGTSHSTA